MLKKVLIVEDYDDVRDFMKLLIEGYGYEVLEAINGIQAVETTKNQHPDLILMDLTMPEMDGLTATRIIRKSGNGFSKTPIIAVTALGDMYYRKAIEAGCNDLIDKPVDFDKLLPILNQYL
jgi:CheY-like chemotaxis protein